MTCPRDGSELVEVERSGVRIDACRTCRGVFLDRGELEKVLERERATIERHDEDDEAFLREVTGAGGGSEHRDAPRAGAATSPGFDRQTAERIFDAYKGHKRGGHGHGEHAKRKKKKSFLDELFD